jgi:hypothetical protein
MPSNGRMTPSGSGTNGRHGSGTGGGGSSMTAKDGASSSRSAPQGSNPSETPKPVSRTFEWGHIIDHVADDKQSLPPWSRGTASVSSSSPPEGIDHIEALKKWEVLNADLTVALRDL